MNRPVVFRRVAREAAGDWYERQRAGLGSAFIASVQRILDRIASQPDFYPVVSNSVREALVHGFPYCVYYQEEKRHILILAVFHTSRDPAAWQQRRWPQ